MGAWADAVIDDVKREWMKGLSAGAIARIINSRHGTSFSRNAVIGKIMRLGLRRGDNPCAPKAPRVYVAKAPRLKLALPKRAANVIPFRAAGPPKYPCPDGFVPGALSKRECHYPTGEIHGGSLAYCGAPTTGNASRPYCPAHHALMFVKPVHKPRKKLVHYVNRVGT